MKTTHDCPYCATAIAVPTAIAVTGEVTPVVVPCPGCGGRFVAEVKVTYLPVSRRIEGEVARISQCACIREVA